MWQSSACQRSNSPLPKISLGWMAVLAILLRGNSFPVILVSTKKRNPGLANHARQGTDAWEELEGQVASCKPCCIQVASLKTMAQGCFGCYIIILRLPQSQSSVLGGEEYRSDCPRGAFANQTGSSNCTECAEGYFAAYVGSVDCDPCPSGYEGLGKGLDSCSRCKRGFYAFRWSNKMLALW